MATIVPVVGIFRNTKRFPHFHGGDQMVPIKDQCGMLGVAMPVNGVALSNFQILLRIL